MNKPIKSFRFILALALAISMTLSLSLPVFAENEVKIDDNFFKLSTAEAFSACELTDTQVVTDIGDGAVRLADGKTEGTIISPIYNLPAFEYLVASWNAETPKDTWIEVYGRAFVDMHKDWSGWLSWGKWGKNIKRGSPCPVETLAKIETDTFTICGSDGEDSTKFQFKIVLHTDDAAVSPALRQVSGTIRNTLDGKAIKTHNQYGNAEIKPSVLLDTPAYSQMVRDGDIGSVICSPTTMTTLVNDKGEDLFPEEMALSDYDWKYEGFGNWSYTVAAGASYGYEAYVQYADFDLLRAELSAGYPVGLSVRYSSTEGGQYPYLKNGAAKSTGGHLITIVGYEKIDGVDYFISNDAATSPDSACAQRKYLAEQLDAAWTGRVAYFVHEKEEGAGTGAPQRISAELVPAASGAEFEYSLTVSGAPVALNPTFSKSKLKALDCGTIMYVRDDGVAKEVPGTRTTTANKPVMYNIAVTTNGNLRIAPNAVLADLEGGATGAITVYAVTNTGVTYVAPLTLTKPAAETPPPEAPAEPPAEAPAEPQAPIDAPKTDGISTKTIIIIAIAVVVLGGAVAIFVVSKKKK